MKRFCSLVLALALTASLAACGSNKGESSKAEESSKSSSAVESTSKKEESSKAEETADYSDVTLSILNSKGEIQEAFEIAAAKYAEEKGLAGFEVLVTSDGDSPYKFMQKAYASGDIPSLAMVDPNDVINFGKEKALPLTDESWASTGGLAMGVSMDSTLYSFPFCVEGRGLIYNKTAIEKITGEEFDYTTIKTLDDFKALCDKLVAGGMASPITIAKEDWSLGAHFLSLVYEEQDFTQEGAAKFTAGLRDGSVDLAADKRFNSLFNTLDAMREYNIYKADPMSADYDLCASYLAEGEVAFWFNGNWGWAEISEYAQDGTEYGIMPVIQDTEASDRANTQITAAGSKQVIISNEVSEKEQAAAKDFLNWLANEPDGQSFLVNDCNLVPAFSNNTLEITNPLGVSIKNFVDAGDVFPGYNEAPGDHWSTLGAAMQKYLVEGNREELATTISSYWQAAQ